MEDDDRTVVRSSHSHRLELPQFGSGEDQNGNWLPVGTRLGEFEITRVVGEGGFGIVYLARDHSLDREVAIKEFMPSGMASRTRAMQVTVRSRQYEDTFHQGLKSFVNEARMLARFHSPSLVEVHSFWEGNGTAYMVMRYYEGPTLRQALKDKLVTPVEPWLIAMLASLLDAMDTIHREQCYHRDIAPDNILILRDGRPLLLDFGAARRVIGDATQSITAILKPGFAPFEQYGETPGIRQGPWTDIYALAAVAYFIIAGKTPPPATARVFNDGMVPAREVGRGRYNDRLLAALDHALAVRPDQRIQNVAEFRAALGLGEGAPRTMPGLAATAPAAAERWPSEPRWSTEPPRSSGTYHALPTQSPADEHLVADTDPAWRPPAAKRGHAGVVVAGIAVVVLLAAGAVGYRWMNATDANPPAVAQAARPGAAAQPDPVGTLPTEPARTESPRTDATDKAIAQSAPPAVVTAPPVAVLPPPSATVPPAATPGPPLAAAQNPEDELWRVATTKDNAAGYEAYLKRYPRGRYASTAAVVLEARQPKVASSAQKPAVAAQAAVPPVQAPAAQPAAAAPAATVAAVKTEPKPAAAEPPTPSSTTQVAGAGAAPAAPTSGATSAPGVPSDTRIASRTTPSPNEGASKGAAKPEPPPVMVVPDLPPSGGGGTIKAPDRTLTGNFAPEPGTGIISGTGLVVWNNGDRFEGRLVKGAKEGKGRYTWSNGQIYTGDWVGDVPNGRGILQFSNGNRYEGDIRAGEPNGRGAMQFASGQRYDGEVKAGKPNGQGTMHFKNGDVYVGQWVDGKHHGAGRFTWANGTFWEGEFKDGQKTENGKTVFADGRAVSGNNNERANQAATSTSDDGKKLTEALVK